VSLFTRRSYPTAQDLIPQRPIQPRQGSMVVTNDTALRHSAVWACLRLRANLISTLPVDVYRRAMGMNLEVPAPPVLVNPGGARVDMIEWLYSTQVDLDRAGNCFGVITETDALNLPKRIDLVSLGDVSIRVKAGELVEYKIGAKLYPPEKIWHERQYTVSGMHVGLSPVAYAAWSIGEYLSIQDFALGWFSGGGVPKAELKNTARVLKPGEATNAKEQFKASMSSGDLFVHGSDWEYKPIQAEQAGSAWLEAKQYGIGDIARFFDCPGDTIDAAVSTGNITYASITQRNLQLLIHHLGPAIVRRETALSKLTPKPRFVKLNTGALLRMDPAARAVMLKTQIDSRVLAPSEARLLDDRPPFTEEQLGEFDRLFPPRGTRPEGGADEPVATPA
jgi:HK97 family phage portal protein